MSYIACGGRPKRPICSTSRKPFVVMRAVLPPRRWINALVATVVPCANASIDERSTPCRSSSCRNAEIAAALGSWGVEGTFMVTEFSASTRIKSVKVPPISMPTFFTLPPVLETAAQQKLGPNTTVQRSPHTGPARYRVQVWVYRNGNWSIAVMRSSQPLLRDVPEVPGTSRLNTLPPARPILGRSSRRTQSPRKPSSGAKQVIFEFKPGVGYL